MNENFNNETVNNVSRNGGLVAKLAVGALGLAAGVGAVLFYKKKKQQVENVEEVIDSNENQDEE